MMEVYEQSIINILRAKGDTKTICTQIALCSAGDFFAMKSGHIRMLRSAAPSLVGTDKCSQGPGYWCESKENAAKCKVTSLNFYLKSWCLANLQIV